eukprot:scaffold23.g4150.t1
MASVEAGEERPLKRYSSSLKRLASGIGRGGANGSTEGGEGPPKRQGSLKRVISGIQRAQAERDAQCPTKPIGMPECVRAYQPRGEDSSCWRFSLSCSFIAGIIVSSVGPFAGIFILDPMTYLGITETQARGGSAAQCHSEIPYQGGSALPVGAGGFPYAPELCAFIAGATGQPPSNFGAAGLAVDHAVAAAFLNAAIGTTSNSAQDAGAQAFALSFLQLSRPAMAASLAVTNPALKTALDPLSDTQWGLLRGYLNNLVTGDNWAELVYGAWTGAGAGNATLASMQDGAVAAFTQALTITQEKYFILALTPITLSVVRGALVAAFTDSPLLRPAVEGYLVSQGANANDPGFPALVNTTARAWALQQWTDCGPFVDVRRERCIAGEAHDAVWDMSSTYGGPVAITLPHFHRASPDFTATTGQTWNADAEAHEWRFAIEPFTGMSVEARKTAQYVHLVARSDQMYPNLWVAPGSAAAARAVGAGFVTVPSFWMTLQWAPFKHVANAILLIRVLKDMKMHRVEKERRELARSRARRARLPRAELAMVAALLDAQRSGGEGGGDLPGEVSEDADDSEEEEEAHAPGLAARLWASLRGLLPRHRGDALVAAEGGRGDGALAQAYGAAVAEKVGGRAGGDAEPESPWLRAVGAKAAAAAPVPEADDTEIQVGRSSRFGAPAFPAMAPMAPFPAPAARAEEEEDVAAVTVVGMALLPEDAPLSDEAAARGVRGAGAGFASNFLRRRTTSSQQEQP